MQIVKVSGLQRSGKSLLLASLLGNLSYSCRAAKFLHISFLKDNIEGYLPSYIKSEYVPKNITVIEDKDADGSTYADLDLKSFSSIVVDVDQNYQSPHLVELVKKATALAKENKIHLYLIEDTEK